MTDNPSRNADKKVDEDWKKRARQEAQGVDAGDGVRGGGAAGAAARPAGSESHDETMESLSPFLRLVSQLAVQASVHLGFMENPGTGKKAKDLNAARQALDTLADLREKTKGNLTADEATYLDDVLYSLRMGYVREKG